MERTGSRITDRRLTLEGKGIIVSEMLGLGDLVCVD